MYIVKKQQTNTVLRSKSLRASEGEKCHVQGKRFKWWYRLANNNVLWYDGLKSLIIATDSELFDFEISNICKVNSLTRKN